ncbi:MAG: HD domain-containing protein [bacterium]|nr:HD domain-containing protein [bacterium]
MRFYAVDGLQPGMVLGQSVYGFRGNLLLVKGKMLDDGFIKRISELGFPGVHVDESGFEEINPPEIIDSSLRAGTHLLMSACLDALQKFTPAILEFDGSVEKSLEAHPELRKALPLSALKEKATQIVDDLLDSYATELPCLLLKAQSHYQEQHAIDTVTISVLLGINFRLIRKELQQLALAALLHDSGKALLAQPGEPNIKPDHPKYKDHPILSGLLVMNSSGSNYTECAIIQQHHERQDGTGFPYRLKGDGKSPSVSRGYQSGNIYRLAEILTVADAYDVLTSGAYRAAMSPESTIRDLIKRCYTEFNPHVVKMLARVIQIFPVGSQVKVTRSSLKKIEGCRGIVSVANSENPHRVRIIKTHDSEGNMTLPEVVSLTGDAEARLELII